LQLSWPLLLRLIVLAGAFLYATLPSFAYCPQPDPTVACEFLNSDAVFVGTVISARAVPPRGAADLDGWLYRLTVQELFRGPRTRTIEVFTENSSGRFPLEVGKTYLLFADKLDGRLTITNCGNSALQSKAQKAIRELHGLVIPQDAVIEGRISFSGIPDSETHIPGIQVIIRTDGRTFKATSDQEGWFHLHVPPGKYSAEVQQIPHWNIAPSSNSCDDPNHFDARKGHCSGLQFVANSE
jgi:hypothetical protein